MRLQMLTLLAYLDPGSGSFILQLILAALLGGAFVLKNYWKKIITSIRRLIKRDSEDEEN